MVVSPQGCQNIFAIDASGETATRTGLLLGSGKTGSYFYTNDDDPYGNMNGYVPHAWLYEAPATGYGNAKGGTGWWTFGQRGGYSPGYQAVGISNAMTPEGGGWWRLYSGQFVGSEFTSTYGYTGWLPELQFRGTDAHTLIYSAPYQGYQPVGFKVSCQSPGIPGSWDTFVVTTAGWRGYKWTPKSNPSGGGLHSFIYYDIPPTVVEPTANGQDLYVSQGKKVFMFRGGLALMRSGSSASLSTTPGFNKRGWIGTLTGLSDMIKDDVGKKIIKLSNAATAGHNFSFMVTAYHSPTSVDIFIPKRNWAILNAPATPSDANNGSINWSIYDGSGKGGDLEPDWSTAKVFGDEVVDGAITWFLVGFTPNYSKSEFVESPLLAIEPRTRGVRQDTIATLAGQAAPKCRSLWATVQPSDTIDNVANQVLFEIDPQEPEWLPLKENGVHIVRVIAAMYGADNGSCRLSGTFKRAAGTISRIGTDENQLSSESGTTFDLNILGDKIQVRVSPGINAVTSYGLFIEIQERCL